MNGATFETERRAFKAELETCHALINQVPAKPKNDRFHALGVFCFTVQAELVGEKQNKSWCCRVTSHERPTTENWRDYFIGYTSLKDYAWSALEPGQKIDVLSIPALGGEAEKVAALLPGEELDRNEPSYHGQAVAIGRLSARQALGASHEASRATVTLDDTDPDVGF